MAFVRSDAWEAQPQSSALALPASLLEHRITRTSAALVISLTIEAGMIAALLLLGDISQPQARPAERSITTIDVASPTAQAQGATAAHAKQTQNAQAPISQVDATPTSPVPQEWSVTTLPPAPMAAPAPLTPSAPAAPAQGLGAAGAGSGAGYDPYAFASYRPPIPSGSVTRPPQVIADAQVRLEQLLRQRLHTGGLQISARLVVDASGRVTRIDLLSSLSSSMTTSLSKTIIGFALCPPDPTRAADASLVLSLTI